MFVKTIKDQAAVEATMTERARKVTLGGVERGVPVGKVAQSKLYGPYDPEATCGRQVLCGFVKTAG